MTEHVREGVQRRTGRSEQGAAALEFALVSPLLLLLVFAIIDFGFGFHAWNAIQNSAREGARLAAVDPNTSDIVTRARKASDFLDSSKLNVAVTCSTNNGVSFGTCAAGASWKAGDIIRVIVTYDYGYMTPLPTMVGLGTTLHVTGTSEARFEGQ